MRIHPAYLPMVRVTKKYRKSGTQEFVATHRDILTYQYSWTDHLYTTRGSKNEGTSGLL